MLRRLKQAVLKGIRATGGLEWVRDTRWRGERLLILCYHGVSIDREHEWRPPLYVTQAFLRKRMEAIREGGYRVLPLDEALSRLYEGTLPPRSVTLTFDDGGYDFYARAHPVLREFGYPVTVYLSTYYCVKGRPIFPNICDYTLWLARGSVHECRGVTDEAFTADLRDEEGRKRVLDRLVSFTRQERMDDTQKQELARRLAAAVGVDYDSLLDDRILQLMRPEEVSELADEGVDFQLHTHRHRSPEGREAYLEEVRENRSLIASMTGETPVHFCYPSGYHTPRFRRWLADEGIASATTCEPGLASPGSPSLLLPRLLDHWGVSEAEFQAWLSGFAHWLPRRSA